MGVVKDKDIMIEKISETRPPSMNQFWLEMFTITGTIAVFINLTNVSLNATDML